MSDANIDEEILQYHDYYYHNALQLSVTVMDCCV